MKARTLSIGEAALEGLIEGPVPPIDDGEGRLREWTEFARSNDLVFELTVDGPSFSLLAASEPVSLPSGEDLRERVRQCLDQLHGIFPEDLRHTVTSTLRSTEALEDGRVQTVYLFTPEGVKVKSRKVAPPAAEAQPALDLGAVRRFVPLLVFAGVLLVAFIVSLFIFDYSDVWSDVSSKYSLRTAGKYELDGAAIDDYVEFEKIGLEKGHLEIEVRRTSRYPASAEAYRSESARVMRSAELTEILAFKKLVDEGNVRVEYIDGDGDVIAEVELGIRGLLEKEEIVLRVPVKEHRKAVRLRFGY